MRTLANGLIGVAAVLAAMAPAVAAQDDDALKTPAEKLLSAPRDLAFVGVTVYTGSGKKLENVNVLVEAGKFTAIGKDLQVPPSFERIEGGALVPGLVLAGSTTSLTRPTRRAPPQITEIRRRRGRRGPPATRRPTSRATFTPDAKVTAKLKPDHPDWATLLKGGITTHGMRPIESGLAGLGGAVRPVGRKSDDMILADEGYLWLGMAANASTKKMLRENFKKAKELIEKRKEAAKKKPEPAKGKPARAEGKPAAKEPAEKKEEPKKEPPKKEPPEKDAPKPGTKPTQGKPADAKKTQPKQAAKPKEDPKLAVLAKVLEGKLPIHVGVSGLSDVVHVLDALGDTDFPLTLYHAFRRGAEDTLDRMIDALKARKARVVVSADFGYRPNTRYYSNPVGKLLAAKISVVMLPGTSKNELDTLWWRLSDMARAGIPREELVRSLTLEPAKLLGVENRVGSIAKGKDANFLHFSRDPFSPATRLIHVYLEGRAVEAMQQGN